ncbi:hypothetical protein [Streptomyces sp. Wh19]|uniref:Uncharacterized protein n=1 Tax=Streptomyces sanglieri TaxID=193460 RepID=A0ABW2X816_9ACTN|nr:hypothetical protein [Streptomyces sp. Wh19]
MAIPAVVAGQVSTAGLHGEPAPGAARPALLGHTVARAACRTAARLTRTRREARR